MAQITDHPKRFALSNELHARPFPSLGPNARAAFLVFKPTENAVGRDRKAEVGHLVSLLDRYGAPHPQPGATHFTTDMGRYHLKWEQHTECVTYTLFFQGPSDRMFAPELFDAFPQDWLDLATVSRITSAIIEIMPMPTRNQMIDHVRDHYVADSLAFSSVLDGAAMIAGDFRIDPAGHHRFSLLVAEGTDTRRIGRIVQRLCEIELYKTMSMLGFARARDMSQGLGHIDRDLSALIENMAQKNEPADEMLEGLLQISADLESTVAQNSFRFGATEAYEAIVNQRIILLREERFEGGQTFQEFMTRRYDPAMRTVKSTVRRMHALSERATRAGDLLRTRVEVERSAQSQDLLHSMDRRADMQLRLQQTVEGLSVVAISYYAVSLVAYLAYPLADYLDISKGMLMALITLPVVAVVYWMVHRIRDRFDD